MDISAKIAEIWQETLQESTENRPQPLLMCMMCQEVAPHTFVSAEPTNHRNGKPTAYALLYRCSTCGHVRRYGLEEVKYHRAPSARTAEDAAQAMQA